MMYVAFVQVSVKTALPEGTDGEGPMGGTKTKQGKTNNFTEEAEEEKEGRGWEEKGGPPTYLASASQGYIGHWAWAGEGRQGTG